MDRRPGVGGGCIADVSQWVASFGGHGKMLAMVVVAYSLEVD